jgi:hypothetical protein
MKIMNFPSTNQMHCHAIVSRELLERCDSGSILRMAIGQASEDVYRSILRKYVNVSGDSTTGDAVISIDCFVFSPKELETLLLNAREQGRQDEQSKRG